MESYEVIQILIKEKIKILFLKDIQTSHSSKFFALSDKFTWILNFYEILRVATDELFNAVAFYAMCANLEIGHFHLLEFKFERLLERARRELLVHYSKCATSQRQVFKEWKGNGISMKWDFLKEYSLVWGLEKLAKVDTQFNRVKLIVR